MRIRLEDIGDEPFSWSEDRRIEPAVLDDDRLVGLSEISWSGTVSPTLNGHLLQARLRYQQSLRCRRCLERVEVPVDAEVMLFIQARGHEPMVGEIELEHEDLDVLWVEDEILDTEPVLMEQLELSVPMTVVCREDCAGLCSECGANLNVAQCDCRRKSTDPRWAVLEGFREVDN